MAVLFIANLASLQAQTDYMDGNLSITADGAAPSNVTTITRITGDLTIGGTIATFPDFAALEVVEGNLVISGITNAGIECHPDRTE